MTDLIARVEELKEMGAGLKCLKESINTSSSAGHPVRGPGFERLLAAAGGDGILEIDSSEDPLSGLLTPNGISQKVGRFPIPPGPGRDFATSSGGLGHAPFQDKHRSAERLKAGFNGCGIV